MLSYDENFKKWQKSGESKTPSGVKIGIFRFVAVLLFCISTSPLWAYTSADIPCGCIVSPEDVSDDCNDYSTVYSNLGITNTNIEAKCKAVAGCKYETECTSGSSGTYTVNGNETLCPNTDSNYQESAAGSWNQNQCYYTTNCAGVNQRSASTDTPHTCRVYYGGKVVCKNSGTQPTCSGAWSPNTNDGICNLNQASLEGFDDNDGNLDYTYHIEVTGDNAKCYSNTRNCNLFTTGSTAVPSVSGTAIWDDNKWNVDGCRKANQQITGAHCTGVLVATNSNITDATADIWTNTNKHFCTKCDAGYIVAGAGYIYQNASIDFCGSVTGTSGIPTSGFPFYICNCAEQAPSGYYTDGQSICDWSSENDDNQCKKNANYFGNYAQCCQKCGPGQTTNEGGGATSEDDCHYTTQTRFCDAHGCFYLSDLGWDADNGYTWGGATSTSSGQ